MNLTPNIDWRDQKTVDAIRGYVRIAFGVAFVCVLLYLMLTGRADPIAVLKALSAILGIGRLTDGVLLMMSNKANG